MAPPGTVTAASSPLPSRTRGPGRRQPLAQLRQQLELAHRLTIPDARDRRSSGRLCGVTKVRRTWSAANHSCTGSARPERGSAPPAAQPPGPPRAPARPRRPRSSASSSSRSSTSGRRSRDEGVHFHVVWLIPAIVILPLFYVLSALGWDLILRFLGYRIGFGRAQVAWGQPLLARYVPGSVLYVLGRVLLSERAGVPRRITIASIVYEQAISATSAIVVAAYFIINHPDLQGQPLRWAVLLLIPAGDRGPAPARLRAARQPGAAAPSAASRCRR